jgi:7-cyano-7-deazaguanine synthase in queuosine biosynthesis
VKLERVDLAPSPDRADTVRLTGRVRYEVAKDGPSEEDYWFEFPASYAGEVSVTGNPWLACLLPVAVELGETLSLCRPVDGRMLDAATERMRIWQWWSAAHAPVAVEADVVAPDASPGRHARTVSLFSGGIDSFYTVLRPRAAPIDDLIVIHGAFDLMYAKREAFERVQAKLASAAGTLGKTLIPSTTNLLHTRLGRTDLVDISQGSMMGAVPLALERRFSRVLIPASKDLDWHEPWGMHPLTDALLSTTRTAVVEDAYPVRRVDKTAFVARSDVALAALRVCLFTGNESNCMDCEKCLRTAIALEAMGVLERAEAFHCKALDVKRVRRMTLGDRHSRHYHEELRGFCREHGRADLAEAVEHALARARRHDPFRPMVRWLRKLPLVGPATHWLEARVQDVGVTWHRAQ